MSAKYVSGSAYQTCKVGFRIVTVGVVDKTTAWTRPSDCPSKEVKEEFGKVVHENFGKLNKDTVRVDMK